MVNTTDIKPIIKATTETLLLRERNAHFSTKVSGLNNIIKQYNDYPEILAAVKEEIEDATKNDSYRKTRLIQLFFTASHLNHVDSVKFLVTEQLINVDANLESTIESEIVKFPDPDTEKKLRSVKNSNNKWNSIFHAVSGNAIETLKFLLDASVKINLDIAKCISEPEDRKITLLHQAMSHVKNNPKELVSLLLANVSEDQKKQFIFKETNHQETALHFAAQNGHADSAEMLFNGLNDDDKLELTEQKTKEGLNALMVASSSGHTNVIELLLKQFSDPAQKQKYVKEIDKKGNSALHFAAHRGLVDSVNLLFNCLDEKEILELIKLQNEKGLNALMVASSSGHTNVIELLLKQFSDPAQKQEYVNEIDKKGNSALYFAARNGDVDSAKLLLECFEDKITFIQETKKKIKGGRTLLSTVCSRNNTDFLKFLLEQFHNDEQKSKFIMDTDYDQNTSLHLATKHGSVDVIQILFNNLKQNEKIKLIKNKNAKESTALGLASYYNCLDIVKLLLKQFNTAEEKYDLIKEVNCKKNTSLHGAYKSIACIAMLLAELSAQQKEELCLMQNDDGNTILHLIAKENTIDTAEYLLKNLPQKSKVKLLHQVNNEEKSAIDLAISANSKCTAILLIKNGAVIKDIANALDKMPDIEASLKNEKKHLRSKKNKKHFLFGAIYAVSLLIPAFSLPIFVKILDLNLSCIKSGIFTDEVICLSVATAFALTIISTAIYFHHKKTSVLAKQEQYCDDQIQKIENHNKNLQKPKSCFDLPDELRNHNLLTMITPQVTFLV